MVVAGRTGEPEDDRWRLGCPLDAFLLFTPLLSSLPRERVAVAFLCEARRLIRIATVAEGDRAAAALPAAAILRAAVVAKAAGILLAHNHPSGDATPSLADIRATRGLATGAAAIGLSVVDHVVLAREEARSFRLMGLM